MALQVAPGTSPTGDGQRRSGSFLNPTGEKGNQPPPKNIGAFMEIFVFSVLVMIKAMHPVVIDASKSVNPETGKKFFAYNTNSTIVTKDCLIAFLSCLFCLIIGGKKQFFSIWGADGGKPFMIFAFDGFLYTLADLFEMASMGGLSGAAYQILMQSSIVITAFLMMCIKGVYQTRLQWTLLFVLMGAMSVYMCITTGGGGGGKSGGGGIPILAIFTSIIKVFAVCGGAVVGDKYAKVYKDDPTHLQVARIYFIRPFILVTASFLTGKMNADYYSNWTLATYTLVVSYIIKALAAIYVLALLDSILKTIAESVAVLVIFGYDVLIMGMKFDVTVFLSVMMVVLACASYVDSKAIVEKAKNYDNATK